MTVAGFPHSHSWLPSANCLNGFSYALAFPLQIREHLGRWHVEQARHEPGKHVQLAVNLTKPAILVGGKNRRPMLPPGDFRRCLPTGQRGRVAELRARSVNDIYFSSRVASRSKLPKSDLDWSFAGKVERAGGELRALARAPCGRKPRKRSITLDRLIIGLIVAGRVGQRPSKARLNILSANR